jgi:hypothetical protein
MKDQPSAFVDTSDGRNLAVRVPGVPDAEARLKEEGFVIVDDFLPRDLGGAFAKLAQTVVERDGVHISRHTEQDTLDYEVVTGEAVQSAAPQLFELYTSPGLVRGFEPSPESRISRHRPTCDPPSTSTA